MFITRYSYKKQLRKCDIAGCHGILNILPFRNNLRQLFIGRTPLCIENKWNSLFQQNPSLYLDGLKLCCSGERFCKVNAKYVRLKHDYKLFSWMPTLGNVSIQEFCKTKSYFYTYSDFLNNRCYVTSASNEPLPKNSNLLKEHLQDVQPANENLRSSQKISKKQLTETKVPTGTLPKQTKALKRALLKEAEKDFEVINKRLDETRQNFRVLFPIPKSNLHNLYQTIGSHLNKALSVKAEYQKNECPQIWKCQVTVPWPELKSFESSAKSKQEASNRASLAVLIWLQEKNVLNARGQLSLLTTTDVQEAKNKPVADVKLSSEAVTVISDLLERYSKEVLGSMKDVQDHGSDEDSENNVDNYISDENILMPQNKIPKSEQWIKQRNEILLNRYNKRRQFETCTLPISSYREEFLNLLTNNSVVVVKGETGCGKSTQVPQYVFDNCVSKMQGTNCTVVVTQPRRISAISLAEYIAYERNERIGDVTGYQVRLKSVLPHPQGGGIIFCSTGILLRKIISDPGLSNISHVIIDEAHERDVNTDFLLTLVKRALQINPTLKVIIMSATINAELFQKYFDNAPALHIPGFTYPVTQQFLDEPLANIIGIKNINEFCQSTQPKVDCKAVAKMVFWINRNRSEGAVLVFLPGWAEIQQTMKYLNENSEDDALFVVPVHSKLSFQQQKLIFDKAPKGKRKVVLATNIAETSITIDDVVYVVDTGAHKEQRLDMKAGIACLDNHWISAANVKQRQGRAGRVQPGESFHLYTKDKYNDFDTFPTPEIFRVPLEKSVLDCKMYSATDEKIEDFFSKLPEPPNPTAINKAVAVLKSLDALDSDEDLTPLGRRIYLFTTHPYLSKALVHSAIFKCVNPVLTIATLMSSEYQIFYNIMENREFVKSVKQSFSPCSDHMALAWLYHQWEEHKHQGKDSLATFCMEKGIYGENMALTERLRILNGDYLYKSQLLDSSVDYTDFNEECNSFARNDELVKAVLLSGLGKIALARNFKFMKGRLKHCNDIVTQTGQSAKVVSDSVNNGRKTYPSPFLTYFRAVSSLERPMLKIWDSSIVSPVALLLFLPGIISMKTMKTLDSSKTVLSVKGHTPININCDHEQAKLILNLRQVMWTVVEYLIEHEGHPADRQQYEVVSRFRDIMLQVLSNVLSEQGVNIDYNAEGELRIQ